MSPQNLGVTEFRPGCGVRVIGGLGLSATGQAVAGNGLLNNLIAYWPGNEAAGNAIDAHTNGLDLTDTNTVTSNPGLVYPLARQYTAANNEYHTRPGDDALLSTGDLDFTIAAWCYFDDLAASRGIAAKFILVPTGEYFLAYSAVPLTFRFAVSNGAAQFNVNNVSLGLPNTSTWYLVVAWHDSVANTINIQSNNAAVDSVAHAAGVQDGTAVFEVGRAAAVAYMNGRIGPTIFWKSAGGAGGVLTAAQRTALYNGGAGLPYASFTT